MSRAIGPTWPLLLIEPFYGGSHRQLVDLLAVNFRGDVHCLPASKWHWRSRVSALHFARTLPAYHDYQVVFCSSVLNLTELVALRPDLASLRKVLYFHENQLVYPVRRQQDRDFQYGYNQILSCLVADCVVFNSHFNMHSFLDAIDGHLRLMPDFRPKGLAELIRPKCQVLYFPVEHPPISGLTDAGQREEVQEESCTGNDEESSAAESSAKCAAVVSQPLHIVWPHRWEHDKGPEEFCEVLQQLVEAGVEFNVSFLGAHTNDIPECLKEVLSRLGQRVLHYGPLPREEYWRVLQQADIAVSTARHEFFGVAMMEAVGCGCYLLCPNRLVYPEIYPSECLYNTKQQLFKRLRRYCEKPWILHHTQLKVDLSKFSWSKLQQDYDRLLNYTVEPPQMIHVSYVGRSLHVPY